MPFLESMMGGRSLGVRSREQGAGEATTYGTDAYRPASPSLASAATERACAADGCTTGWMMPWKNRRRPIFEREWGCSSRCLAAMVRMEVRRELGETTATASHDPHRHRVPLGLVLLAQGWITNPQLQSALQLQRASGRGRIGDWLNQTCGLDEERITRGLGVQWSCPVLNLDGFSPSAMALVMPKRFIAEFGLLPLRVAGSSLIYLAFQERMDAALALAVARTTGLQVESGLLDRTRFEAARAAVLAAESVPVKIDRVGDADRLTAAIVKAIEQRQPIATRLVRVHQYYWLRLWLETGAVGVVGSLPREPVDVEDYLFVMDARSTS